MGKNFIKGIVLLLFSFYSGPANAQGKNKVTISIENKADINFNQHIITVPWKDVLAKYPSIDPSYFTVINASTQKEIPFQLEYHGEAAIQNLLILADVPAKSALKICLQKRRPAVFSSKTYCRYVPERKDDFAWENDKIAFRMYGKALEDTKENAYGIDVWVKRTDRLILNERYKKGEYHIDHGDGMDYYHVGFSLGAGNIAPYIHDSIWYPKNYRHWKVMDNGPLRSTFQLDYDEWDAAGRMVSMKKTVSLDAGSQLSRVEVNYRFTNNDSLPVVVGIIKRKEPGAVLLDEQNGIMGYWEPEHEKDGITGTGCIFLKPVLRMNVTREHLLTQAKAGKEESFVYYAGAAWNKARVIMSAQDWFYYLQVFQKQLEQPVEIKFQ